MADEVKSAHRWRPGDRPGRPGTPPPVRLGAAVPTPGIHDRLLTVLDRPGPMAENLRPGLLPWRCPAKVRKRFPGVARQGSCHCLRTAMSLRAMWLRPGVKPARKINRW